VLGKPFMEDSQICVQGKYQAEKGRFYREEGQFFALHRGEKHLVMCRSASFVGQESLWQKLSKRASLGAEKKKWLIPTVRRPEGFTNRW